MAPIACPCCRAMNETPPTCRRCKADLSLVFGVAAQRDALMATAAQQMASGEYFAALYALGDAESLRTGDDIARMRAAVHLLNRDFQTAWACYSAFHNGQDAS